MHRSLEGPWARLVDAKSRVLARVAAFDLGSREARPDPAGWSIGDVVEHLILVEAGVRTVLAKEPSPDRPRAFPSGHWWRYPALRGALKLGVRIRAPVDSILPKRDTSWEPLLMRWEENRRLLGDWLAGCPPEILQDPRFRHPIVGWLTVPEAIAFAGDHIHHHLQQIRRIERALPR